MRFRGVIFLLSGMAASAEVTAEQAEFFEKRIRPVLVKECYACHSDVLAKPMGGVRLDTREGLASWSANGRLAEVISYRGTKKMPPSGKLPGEVVNDFETWMRAGAPDPRKAGGSAVRTQQIDWTSARRFWAFAPVSKRAVPAVRNAAWVQSPIDAFVLASLEQANLSPARPADPRSLIRRVTYDLTGLPPLPEEVAAFLSDSAPGAFARVVDRLLASPHYGERWARHWLDLVRYAETNGHEYDNDKQAPWRYRDYVIRAFNEDVPYDQFVREHIAGDLLSRPRLSRDGTLAESPLATAFFWFGEVLNSATDSVKSRADEVDNQIDVAGKAFQGLTIACARCHDHKFDPIPTADYYALAGVLHSTALREEVVDSPARTARLRELRRDLTAIAAQRRELLGQQPRASRTQYREGDKVLARFEDSFSEWSVSGMAFGDAPLAGEANSIASGSKRFVGTLTSPKFRTGKEQYLHLRIGGTKGDAKLKENGKLRLSSVCDGYKGQHVAADGQPGRAWKTLTLVLERERTCYLEIVDHDRDGYIVVDEIVYSDHKEPPVTIDAPAAEPEPGPGVMAELDRLSAQQAALEAEIPESAFATVAADLDPRDVRIHVRGSHQQLGETIPRGFLQVTSAVPRPRPQGSGRLDVAEQLASAQNPLTARVMVNRIWQHHFGQGLVRTPDNFGLMGETPTHPELLDYLAAAFVENGWSIKKLHRLILLSSAYQMSSVAVPEALQTDPRNRLLHHVPVRRLEAEAIRDAMLTVSGRLDRTLFGPSVTPHISRFQDGRGKPVSGPLDGAGRRSIYLQVRRNFLTPLLLAFDYPLPISAMGARGVSTVPSQALILMNNEFVAEQARLWARRARAAAPSRESRIRWLFETAYARPPEQRETEEIERFLGPRDDDEAWTEVAHVLMNAAEFYYVR